MLETLVIALLSAVFGGVVVYGVRRKSPAAAATEPLPASGLMSVKPESAQFSAIINHSLNPIWVHDAQLNIVYCNPAFAELAEESTDQVLAVGQLELYAGHRELASKAWQTGKEQIEHRYIVAGGDRRYFMIRELPLKSSGVILGYASNLHELDEAKKDIERHTAALRDLLESSTSATAIYGPDTKLKFYNFAFVSLWKLDDDWLDSEPTYGEVLEALREKRKLPEQANFQAFKQTQTKLFTTLIEPQEEFFYLPDGKILRAIAIPHALGGILFAYEDVTDRLALERSYNTLIAVQRETLDNLHEGIVVFGENGRMKLYNPKFAKLWGLTGDITGGEPHIREVMTECRRYFEPGGWETKQEEFIVRIQQRRPFTVRFERRDGTVIDCTGVPLPDGASLLTFTDVTDSTLVERSLREKNEALETADRMKTEFLANVSYELRSPLTSISGFAEMLKRRYVGELNETQEEYIGHIIKSSEHLAHMIGDIIDLASVEAGYMKLDRKRFNIREALDAALSLLSERVRIQDITLVREIDPEISEISADEARIKQVFFNLIGSAVRISKQKGRIVIRLRGAEDKALILEVEDSGKGKFAGNPLSEGNAPQANLELGLSVASRFIELHGGTMRVENRDGEGTRVVCVIPGALG
jgi:signal transduction histidine kinase